MWSFFGSKPSCPIEPEAREWIDARFSWLGRQFGPIDPHRQQVILPTPEFFPDEYDGLPEHAEAMMRRIAQYMGVAPARLELFLYSEARPQVLGSTSSSGSAGVYLHGGGWESDDGRPVVIGIEQSQLNDPMSLAATLAHEIGHELLLGQGRISSDEHDHEPLTDLLTVFLGMGIFTANATIRDRGWSDGMWAGWQTSRHGYLDQRMLGYALAKYAIARGEAKVSWSAHVRPDVRSVMAKSLKYLAALDS